jgi:acyl-CoA dehydrogenase
MSTAASDALICIGGTDLMNAIVDNHEAPMVVSSIMKQNCTERGRRIMEYGMDVAAGSAICRGDKNYLASGYMSMPIGITVEGANIMTRSFQIIGQGLTRCHPHMLELIQCLQAPPEKEKESIEIFSRQFYKVVGHGLTNFFGSITRGLSATVATKTRSKNAYKDGNKLLDYHEKQLLRLSANFALTADLCFTLGGRLKFEELLMGRLSDAIGAIFLGYATLHHYSRKRGVEGLEAVTEHAMLRLETEAQEALKAASDNFPGPLGPVASTVMKMGCFPLGNLTRPYSNPPDELTKEVARMISTPSAMRDFFQEGIYMSKEGTPHHISDLVRALPVCVEADKIAAVLRREKREASDFEAETLKRAEVLRDALIQVDVFDNLGAKETWATRPALIGTQERLAAAESKAFAA